MATIARMGTTMLTARGGTSRASRTSKAASSTVSSPSALSTIPCAARASALRIGPRSRPRQAVNPASVTAAMA